MSKHTSILVKNIANKHFVEAKHALEKCLEEKVKARFKNILKSNSKSRKK